MGEFTTNDSEPFYRRKRWNMSWPIDSLIKTMHHFPKLSKTGRMIGTSICGSIASAGTAVAASHAVYHRSLMGTFSEWFLRIRNYQWEYRTPRNADVFMAEEIPRDESHYSIPRTVPMDIPVLDTAFGDMQLLVLNPQNQSGRNQSLSSCPTSSSGSAPTILYIHGGAFVALPLTFHWRFLNKVAKRTGARIIVPFYPLAPVHTYKAAFPRILVLYTELLEQVGKDRLIVMGDSAGGGIAAALCELLTQESIEQPSQLILLSPWVDLVMDNPDIPAYATVDPLLALPGQREMARAWSGGDDLSFYLLSPLRGDVSGLQQVTIYISTRELLYPDAVAFFEKLCSAGINSQLHIGQGVNHVYPFYPTPEASRAIRDICAAITGQRTSC